MNQRKKNRVSLWARRVLGRATLFAMLTATLLGASQAPCGSDHAGKLLSRVLPQMHLSRKPFDDALARAALDVYLNMLDFDHTFFLQSDIDSFRKEASQLDDAVRDGDVCLAFRIYDTLKARVSNRVEYVDQVLKEGFDLNTAETYVWKRKNAPWPKDEKEWNELWRKKVQNEYVTRLVILRVSTNVTETAIDESSSEETHESPSEANLSPEEQIRKAYRQYLTVLNDNDAEWVVEQYLTAFSRAYDPHTDYMSKSHAEDFDIGVTLSLTGIGALLTTEDGAAKIERLIPGGPAEKDGRLKPGDKIIAVAQGDGEAVDVLHWPLRRTVRLIRGPKGSKVVLTVIRASDPTGATIDKIDLIRDEVRLEEQAAKSDILEWRDALGQTYRFGVISLPDFYSDAGIKKDSRQAERSSAKDVKRELLKLKAAGVQGVVLDLRNNGGGLLSEAIDTTGLFIDSGPVVQVQSRAGLRILTDDDPECVYEGPLVVLVNRQTASASEILAGALQDYGRAIVVGDKKTHGKGTVQSLAPLRNDKPDLGTLKVTTATFHRIDGASTQLRGVQPDIALPSILDALEIGEESLPYALPWTRVYPCLYRRSAELDIIMPEIKDRARKRQETDTRYQTYLKLVERITQRQRNNEIPLNLEARIKMAEEERDLQRILKELSASVAKEPGTKLMQDIVLQEGLCVLADWVSFRQAAERLAASAHTNRMAALVP